MRRFLAEQMRIWGAVARENHDMRTHAALLGALPALARPGADQFTLELGQPAEHCQHQSAVSDRGIGPGVLEALEPGAAFGDRRNDVEQVAR